MLADNKTYYTQDEVVDEQGFYDLYLQLNAEEIAILAHKSRDMIRNCSLNGIENSIEEQCDELRSGSQALFSPNHGVCYMFNTVHKDEINSSLTADWPGPSQGLALVLDIEGKNMV